ncbi:MAG: hypothetical protein SFV81_01910 [Pirellulaceae bacterium]|nr:hypothetical protein [Pirellulaceae bacterium]
MTWARYYPFTLGLLAAVTMAAALARLLPGSLPLDWSSNFGFAPKHIASGDLLRLITRLITSVFLTHDGLHFACAVTMISLVVGWSERTLGLWSTFFNFAFSHLTSMLAFAIGVSLLQFTFVSQTMASLYDFQDVGPSAGYYGCLGALLIASKVPYKQLIIAGVLIILAIRVLLSAKSMPESHALLSADLVHLIAILVGMAIRWVGWSMPRTGRPAA